MKPTRLAGALASVALLAGCGITHHTAALASHTPAAHTVPVHALAADPALELLNDLHISFLR